MRPAKPPSCRLFVLLARESPLAVIFRRGPSRHVLCVLWDRQRGTFEEGQWLYGRIYERRCDLSPSGKRLLYFAAKYNTKMATWSAVSKPPWLTAVVLWPKGDAWGGGGLFDNERLISLDNGYSPLAVAPGTKLPPNLEVRQLVRAGGGGEGFPLYEMRLLRDGWRKVSSGKGREEYRASPWIRFEPPIEYARVRPGDDEHELRMRVVGIREQSGSWWLVEHEVIGPRGMFLGRTEWADWDRTGDLLFSRGGGLYRSKSLGEPKLLIDLTDRKFEARKAPPSALSW